MIDINHPKYVTIKRATTALATASVAAVAVVASVAVSKKKKHHGWLNITFYFGRNENYGKINAVKNEARRIMCSTKLRTILRSVECHFKNAVYTVRGIVL